LHISTCYILEYNEEAILILIKEGFFIGNLEIIKEHDTIYGDERLAKIRISLRAFILSL